MYSIFLGHRYRQERWLQPPCLAVHPHPCPGGVRSQTWPPGVQRHESCNFDLVRRVATLVYVCVSCSLFSIPPNSAKRKEARLTLSRHGSGWASIVSPSTREMDDPRWSLACLYELSTIAFLPDGNRPDFARHRGAECAEDRRQSDFTCPLRAGAWLPPPPRSRVGSASRDTTPNDHTHRRLSRHRTSDCLILLFEEPRQSPPPSSLAKRTCPVIGRTDSPRS